jgi:hypothetical protein
MISLIEKPMWNDAPTFADALGVCQIPGDDSYGEWCWLRLGGVTPKNFSSVEQRPKETK